MVCRICDRELKDHNKKQRDDCLNKALAEMPEERAEMYRREIEITEKRIRRDTKSIYCLFGIVGSLITMLIQYAMTMPSALNAYGDFLKTLDPDNFWKNFHVYSFDPYYISWIVPGSILVTCWLSYRRLNPNEKDIMKRALTGDLSK